MPYQLTVQRSSNYINVKDYGAQGNGTTDDTAAFNAALAALPTTTISTGGGSPTTTTVHNGTIFVPAGTYKIGSSGDINNLGPMVNLVGAGRNAVQLNYYGSNDCIRVYNPLRPASDTFDTLSAYYGAINGITIDGTNAGASASGLHYGDTEGGQLGPDLMIQNFTGASAIGLHLDNTISWTESIRAWLTVSNCTNCIVFDGTSSPTGDISFEYNELHFKCYCYANQNGIILRGGAWIHHGELVVRANMALSGSAQSSALLTITGTGTTGHVGANSNSQISNARLDIYAETNTLYGGGSSNGPKTIKFGNAGDSAAIQYCNGTMSFDGSNWIASDYTPATLLYNGIIRGDSVLRNAARVWFPGQMLLNGGATVQYRAYLYNSNHDNYRESILLPAGIGDVSPLATGVLTLVAIPLYAGDIVTNITFKSHTTAAGTPTHWWFALYDGSYNLLGQTADQTSTAWGTFTAKTLALTSAYTVTASGIYYAAIMVAATTVPSLDGLTASSSSTGAAAYLTGQKLLAGQFGSGYTTTAPSSAASPAAIGSIPYCIIS